MRLVRVCLLLLTVALATSCATTTTTAPDPGQQILGRWQSNLAGFKVTSIYSATDVMTEGHAGVPYTLNGDRLTLAADSTTARIVSFPAAGEMIQLDPMTGTEHRYTRPTD